MGDVASVNTLQCGASICRSSVPPRFSILICHLLLFHLTTLTFHILCIFVQLSFSSICLCLKGIQRGRLPITCISVVVRINFGPISCVTIDHSLPVFLARSPIKTAHRWPRGRALLPASGGHKESRKTLHS